jgi:DNA-binding PadR family transcriptional regulator
VRAEPTREDAERTHAERRSAPDPYLPGRDLKLPRTEVREPIQAGCKVYHLRVSESRALATVGAFRVIPAADLEEQRPARDVWHGDVQRLADQGLIERTRVSIGGRPTAVVVLTREGKALLEAHQQTREDGREQRYHAGLVKPRELSHDAQLYRLYQAEAARIEEDGGQVTRVVLDYELKHEYQTFLNRPDHTEDQDRESDLRTMGGVAPAAV